jgi:hypothetical protein
MRTATEILAEIERLEETRPIDPRMESLRQQRIDALNAEWIAVADSVLDAMPDAAYDADDFRDLGGMGVEPR